MTRAGSLVRVQKYSCWAFSLPEIVTQAQSLRKLTVSHQYMMAHGQRFALWEQFENPCSYRI